MSLLKPDDQGIEHSKRLKSFILSRLRETGGALSFAEYMDLALYAPGLGYYVAGAHKLGKGGDFTTAPLISPLFSYTLAKQCCALFDSGIAPTFLELGAGTGHMAYDILAYCQKTNLPTSYKILEVSPELRERQQKMLKSFDNVEWLDTLPEGFEGIILANEVIDALPVDRFLMRDGALLEQTVIEKAGDLILSSRPASDAYQVLIQDSLPYREGYESEVHTRAFPWIKALSNSLKQGAIFLIDYGFDNDTFYHPDRSQGTLMCHYRHHAHSDALWYPGLQDITAHVNFSHIAKAGLDNDLTLEGYIPQGHFLLNNDILSLVEASDDKQNRFTHNQAIKKLTLPHEMGELFKVMAFSRGFDDLPPWQGFYQGDSTHKL